MQCFYEQLCLCLMQNVVICDKHSERKNSYVDSVITAVLCTGMLNTRLFRRSLIKSFYLCAICY
jgi:hypothetical protein